MIKEIIWTVMLSVSVSFITVHTLTKRLIDNIIQQESIFLDQVKEITIKTIDENTKKREL